ncbi:MAG: hypothetical protein IBX62_01880 [Coriobacteriia bacterium]|nr:hypothetical protein [Coriobacteriia bacterium]
MRRFGEELAAAGVIQVGGAFTDIPEADALVKSRPEAFLIGLLFTQGIPAERAWAGPWLLMRRLGHLDLARMADEPEAVRAALQRSPMLHRFKETLPRWVVAAARKVLDEYDGDASRIWTPGSRVLDVVERLQAFQGIGRKKAVMGAEMLVRCLGVSLAGVECGQVAYDVHVRRVFLRSGLVERDSPEDVEAAARTASPAEPGLMDLPAWLVGRQWCRPNRPACEACRLAAACPRRVWLRPEGVGARRRER